jgi:nickel transport protein
MKWPLLALLLVAAAPAEAHRLKLFATAEGNVLVGEAYFAGGGPAIDIPGRVLAADGSLAGAFATGPDGRFRVTVGQRQDYTLTVDGGDGHVASYMLPGAELPESLPAGQAGRAAPPAETGPIAPATPGPELTQLIEVAVARQVRPVREQLDAYEATVRLHDILGGIGTIFGVFGLAAWFASRRKP